MSLDSDDSRTSSSDSNSTASQYYSEWATSTRLWLDMTLENWRDMLTNDFVMSLPLKRHEHKTVTSKNAHIFPIEQAEKPPILVSQLECHRFEFSMKTETEVWDIIRQLKIESLSVQVHMPNVPSSDYQDYNNDTCPDFFIEVAQAVHFKLRMSKFALEEDLGLKKYYTDLFIPLGRIMSFFGRKTMLTEGHEIVPARFCYGCDLGHVKGDKDWYQCDECNRVYCDESFGDVGQNCGNCGYTACCGDMEFWYDDNGTEMYCSKCSPYHSFTLDNRKVLSSVEASDISDD